MSPSKLRQVDFFWLILVKVSHVRNIFIAQCRETGCQWQEIQSLFVVIESWALFMSGKAISRLFQEWMAPSGQLAAAEEMEMSLDLSNCVDSAVTGSKKKRSDFILFYWSLGAFALWLKSVDGTSSEGGVLNSRDVSSCKQRDIALTIACNSSQSPLG